jgi:hypothetical protein
MISKSHPVLIPRTYTNHVSWNTLCQRECLLHQVSVLFNDAVKYYDYLSNSMEYWWHNSDKEFDTIEQCSNELEAPGFPGVKLVIGSELVNTDPVSNSLSM